MSTVTVARLADYTEAAHRSDADFARDNWEPGVLDPARITVRQTSSWGLVLTLPDERSWLDVRVVRAFPLSHGHQWFAFLNRKNEEIGTIKALEDLEEQTRDLVTRELANRYLVNTITRIFALRSEGDTLYWDVETQRGRRDFVMKANRETVVRPDNHRLLIVDVDGNRFVIPDLACLDRNSIAIMNTVV